MLTGDIIVTTTTTITIIGSIRLHFVTQRDNWVSMEPDAAPCMHAFDYHPVCYFIFNIIIMHLTMIICPTSSTTL